MKLVLKVRGTQGIIQQIKDSFVVAFLCRADLVLRLIHQEIEIFVKVDFFAVNCDGVVFCIDLSCRIVGAVTVHEDLAAAQEFTDIFA